MPAWVQTLSVGKDIKVGLVNNTVQTYKLNYIGNTEAEHITKKIKSEDITHKKDVEMKG